MDKISKQMYSVSGYKNVTTTENSDMNWIFKYNVGK